MIFAMNRQKKLHVKNMIFSTGQSENIQDFRQIHRSKWMILFLYCYFLLFLILELNYIS